jgi:hypothetical protein
MRDVLWGVAPGLVPEPGPQRRLVADRADGDPQALGPAPVVALMGVRAALELDEFLVLELALEAAMSAGHVGESYVDDNAPEVASLVGSCPQPRRPGPGGH